MNEFKGVVCTARILADSISPQGVRLTTFELEYPRIVHSELVVHGMLPRNSASSRAIPFSKMVKQLTARPARFGKNQAGMQDTGEDHDALVEGDTWNTSSELDATEALSPEEAWGRAKEDAVKWAERFNKAGFHKQITGRLTEPFQMMKTVLSATELANFFWLRDDVAADPTLHDLAKAMREAYEKSVPELLQPGEWHLPYVTTSYDDVMGCRMYWEFGMDSRAITLAEAIKVSEARCAAVSFRNIDYGLEKCLEVHDRLVEDVRKHASAFQHQATPMEKVTIGMTGVSVNVPAWPDSWEPGISHADRNGQLWSAQFRGWIMNRKLIKGENYEGPLDSPQ